MGEYWASDQLAHWLRAGPLADDAAEAGGGPVEDVALLTFEAALGAEDVAVGANGKGCEKNWTRM